MAYPLQQGWNTQPQTYQYQYQQSQQNPQGAMIWVQGEAGAKSYMVAPGCAVVLFDSEKPVFYIKSTDQSGMPQPLKTYDFSEHKEQPEQKPDMSQYVTKDELEQYLKDLLGGEKK